MVTALHATGLRASENTPLWLMDGMGQRPLYPPNVSGWKHNGYWVNASAMTQRISAARHFQWRAMSGYWSGDGLIRLGGGNLSKNEIENVHRDEPAWVVDRILELMRMPLSSSSRAALLTYSTESAWWERSDLVGLTLMAPEFHTA